MTIDDDISFFERIPFFALLGRDALRILAIGAESRYVKTGEYLFVAGAPADAAFLIIEGSFALKPKITEANLQETRASRGALLGEISMLTETSFPVTAIALEPSTVICIKRSLFMKMLEGFPEAALRLRNHIAGRVSNFTKELQNVAKRLNSTK